MKRTEQEICDSMILDVDVTLKDDGNIRLKYVAVSGGCGPEISMDMALAKRTIVALQHQIDFVETNEPICQI
jgi:hypothetical protein